MMHDALESFNLQLQVKTIRPLFRMQFRHGHFYFCTEIPNEITRTDTLLPAYTKFDHFQ